MSRSRMSAGLAVLALVAASVFGGTVSASAAPVSVPVFTNPAPGPDSDAQPQVEGNLSQEIAHVDVVITVTNSLGTYEYCTDPNINATVFGAPFSCTSAVPLPYGDNTFTATSYYTGDVNPGTPSLPLVYTHWDPTGHVELLTGPAASGTDPTVSFAGTGPALGTVALYESTFFGDQICETDVLPDGTWQCDLAFSLDPGSYQVTVFAGGTFFFDGSGPVIDDTAGPFLFDVVLPPGASVDQLFTPWVTSGIPMGMQGSKDINATYIQVYSAPAVTGPWTPYCQTSGVIIGATVWSCDPAFGALQPGTNYISALAFYADTSSSDFGPSAIVELVAPPTIDSPADGLLTNDSTPTFAGTAPTGASATVYRTSVGSICSGPVVAGAYTCDAAPLADGTYSYFVYVTPGDGVTSASRTLTIDTVAPSTPVITSPNTTTDTRPLISGTAEPFATVILYRDGAPASCQEGALTANSAGQWSCTSVAILTPGSSYDYGAKQIDAAGNHSTPGAPGIQLTLTVLRPAVQPTPTPIPTPEPPQPWTFSFGAGGTEFEPGDSTVLSGSNLPPGAAVQAEFHSVPVALGATTVQADGSFSLRVTVPEDALAGLHQFVVTITPTTGLPSTQRQAVTVRMPPRAVADSPAKEPQSSTLVAFGADRNDPAAPSGLTHAIKTTQWILENPVVIGAAAVAGLALLLLVAFPAELLNSTVAEQYERFSKRMPRVRAPWWRRFSAWLKSTPLFGGLAMIIAASVIFGFADPGFGFDVTSLRVVLACAIALFVVGYLASVIAGVIIRRRWSLDTAMELKPLGLILTVVGVVLSRLLEFSPGFLIGLILGISLVGATTVAQRAKATLVQAGVVFGLAMLGWVGYSILAATVAPDSFATALAFDTLVAITSEGLVALFIGLLPLKYLSGEGVFAYSKVIWAACYVVATAAFLLIVVPSAWGEFGGSLGLWIAILGGFAVVAVGIYLYFRFWAPPLEGETAEEADEDAAPSREDART